MAYALAVDVGTNFTSAAAAFKGPDGLLQARPVPLAPSGDVAPSVAYAADDGSLLFGEEAEVHGRANPGRLLRNYQHRVGDPVRLRAGGSSYAAEQIFAAAALWVRKQAVDQEGLPPGALVVSHPLAWGEHKRSLLQGALADIGLVDVMLIPAAAAAASYFASRNDVGPGQTVAVYDVGASFNSAVWQKDSDGNFSLLGHDDRTETIGSSHFDDAVLRHVASNAGGAIPALNTFKSSDRKTAADIRSRCAVAKDELCAVPTTTISVPLPERHLQVRLTRREFEDSVVELLDESIGGLLQTVGRAGKRCEDLMAVVLTGESSRIPLVAQRVSERTNRPVFVDADSHAGVPLGAVLAAASTISLQQHTSDGVLGEAAAEPEPSHAMPTRGGPRRGAKGRPPGTAARPGASRSRLSGKFTAAATVAALAVFALAGAQGPTEHTASIASKGGETQRFHVGQPHQPAATPDAVPAVPHMAAPGDGTPPALSGVEPAAFSSHIPSTPPPASFPLEPGDDPADDPHNTSFAPLTPAGSSAGAATPAEAEAPSESQESPEAPQPGNASSTAPFAPDVAPESPGIPAPDDHAEPIAPVEGGGPIAPIEPEPVPAVTPEVPPSPASEASPDATVSAIPTPVE